MLYRRFTSDAGGSTVSEYNNNNISKDLKLVEWDPAFCSKIYSDTEEFSKKLADLQHLKSNQKFPKISKI